MFTVESIATAPASDNTVIEFASLAEIITYTSLAQAAEWSAEALAEVVGE